MHHRHHLRVILVTLLNLFLKPLVTIVLLVHTYNIALLYMHVATLLHAAESDHVDTAILLSDKPSSAGTCVRRVCPH